MIKEKKQCQPASQSDLKKEKRKEKTGELRLLA
jgi:hypothetical protein